jgi:hypothetical protein
MEGNVGKGLSPINVRVRVRKLSKAHGVIAQLGKEIVA